MIAYYQNNPNQPKRANTQPNFFTNTEPILNRSFLRRPTLELARIRFEKKLKKNGKIEQTNNIFNENDENKNSNPKLNSKKQENINLLNKTLSYSHNEQNYSPIRSLTIERKQKKNQDLITKQNEVMNWIENFLGKKLFQHSPLALLKEGKILYEIIFKIKNSKIGSNPGNTKENIPNKSIQYISTFLQECESLGIAKSDLFTVSDLIEGKNMFQVFHTLDILKMHYQKNYPEKLNENSSESSDNIEPEIEADDEFEDLSFYLENQENENENENENSQKNFKINLNNNKKNGNENHENGDEKKTNHDIDIDIDNDIDIDINIQAFETPSLEEPIHEYFEDKKKKTKLHSRSFSHHLVLQTRKNKHRFVSKANPQKESKTQQKTRKQNIKANNPNNKRFSLFPQQKKNVEINVYKFQLENLIDKMKNNLDLLKHQEDNSVNKLRKLEKSLIEDVENEKISKVGNRRLKYHFKFGYIYSSRIKIGNGNDLIEKIRIQKEPNDKKEKLDAISQIAEINEFTIKTSKLLNSIFNSFSMNLILKSKDDEDYFFEPKNVESQELLISNKFGYSSLKHFQKFQGIEDNQENSQQYQSFLYIFEMMDFISTKLSEINSNLSRKTIWNDSIQKETKTKVLKTISRYLLRVLLYLKSQFKEDFNDNLLKNYIDYSNYTGLIPDELIKNVISKF
ncbi:calponin [Anaeramoeba ignava]|uniref:Calponin n=1 Tax=Anaeramoeba ignava TaxID=1746090 RepID=A0A9Q0R9F9_ANAIG|nr:calponin [Anaeramoeba ignava]